MDISAFDIYLIMMADNFVTLFGVLAGVFCAITVVLLVCLIVSSDKEGEKMAEDRKAVTKLAKIFGAGFVIFVMIAVFAPDTKTLIAMYAIPEVIDIASELRNSDKVGEIGDKSYRALNSLLDQYIAQDNQGS